ncbi:MAG: F0F1 ATP synthase subunit B, partial [bacterium]|nr:F0F1 ATP synthase subunit B [bacterium]
MEAFSRLGIDWNSVILYLINFGILAVVVGYFVTGPILRILDQRRQHIQSAVEEAEKLKQEFLRE